MMHGMPPPQYYGGGPRDCYPPPRHETHRVVGSALDDTHRNPNKIFVGGLCPRVTDEILKRYFQSKYGRVVDAAIVVDKSTGASKGFGFCSFASEDCVNKCIAEEHVIEGTKVDIRRAVPSSEMPSKSDKSGAVDHCKVFVGGLPNDMAEAELLEFCQSFGAVKEVSLRCDEKNRSRGFGFVTFSDPEAAGRCTGQQEIRGGHKIEIKKAVPRSGWQKGAAPGRPGRQNDYRGTSQSGYGAPSNGMPCGYGAPPSYGPPGTYPHPSYGHPPYDGRYGGPPRDYGGPPRDYGAPTRDYGAPPRDYGAPRYGDYDAGYACPRPANGHMNYDGPQRGARYAGGPRIHPY